MYFDDRLTMSSCHAKTRHDRDVQSTPFIRGHMPVQLHGMGDPRIPCIHYCPLPYMEYRSKKTKTFCNRTRRSQAPDLPHTFQTYRRLLLLKPQTLGPSACQSPKFPPSSANSRGSPGKKLSFFRISSIFVGFLRATCKVGLIETCGQRCSLGETSLYMSMSLV